MIILNTSSYAEAQKIAEEDPLHKSGARAYSINAWLLNEGSINLRVTLHTKVVEIQ